MAALQHSGMPRVKLESVPNGNVKQELTDQDVDMTSPQAYMDDDGDELEDGGDLDFINAQQQLWLTKIPRPLWDIWSTMGLDDEIELGTIRVEGPQDNPLRVSLKLHQLDSFRGHPKEYTLKPTSKDRLRSKHPGQALVFSEQHLPGYKPKPFSWENVDEDGNIGQGRSQLYEKNRRDQKRKENNGRFQPYAKKPIPKKTALAGTVVRELEAVIVKNNEYYGIEDKLQNERMEKHKKEQEASIIVTDPAEMKRLRAGNASYMATDAQKAAVHKAKQEKKQRQQDGRPILTAAQLQEMLFVLFGEFRIWKFKELKVRTGQAQRPLEEGLRVIAIKHTSGDFVNMWELKDIYKNKPELLSARDVAPDTVGDSDVDRSGVEDGDDDDDEANMKFEDVMTEATR